MISIKNLVVDVKDIPVTWLFEHYCKLNVRLSGQDVMIKSLFNPNEKNPSFWIYFNKKHNKYQFNDFSTGEAGDGFNLIQKLYKISPKECVARAFKDYKKFLVDNPNGYNASEFKEHAKYKVSDCVKRLWNNLDKDYWTQYNIGSKILDRYNVHPLESYTMKKQDDPEDIFIIKRPYLYGYFREDGDLYKIYQPKVTDKKFLKVKSYIQGTDQLKLEQPYLIIGSSLKDIMCLEGFGYNLETVAPDSENTLMSSHVVDAYKHKYKSVCTLFDNDEAGIKAMKKYEEKYGLAGVHLKLEKDLSDSVVKYGRDKISEILYPLLQKALIKQINPTWQKNIVV